MLGINNGKRQGEMKRRGGCGKDPKQPILNQKEEVLSLEVENKNRRVKARKNQSKLQKRLV